MKKTSLTAISMPEQAKLIRESSDTLDFSHYDHMKTGTIIKWSSGVIVTGYPALLMSFIGVGPWPWLAFSFGLASVVTGIVSFGTFCTDSAKRMKYNFSHRSEPIKLGAWKSQTTKPSYSGETYRGIKISQRSRRSIFSAVLHPMRLFRKILLTETIWYDPSGDYFTLNRSYMGLFNWVDTQQLYAGRRRTFGQTLNSLEEKAPELSQGKAE